MYTTSSPTESGRYNAVERWSIKSQSDKAGAQTLRHGPSLTSALDAICTSYSRPPGATQVLKGLEVSVCMRIVTIRQLQTFRWMPLSVWLWLACMWRTNEDTNTMASTIIRPRIDDRSDLGRVSPCKVGRLTRVCCCPLSFVDVDV
jgi:hypothetical protein